MWNRDGVIVFASIDSGLLYRVSAAGGEPTAVTAFDQTSGQVNSRLKTFGNQFSGARIQREAETLARAIGDIGGASKLTESEI